jgi:FlaA1/EpsC-like NDP-sugar epimerase
MFWYFGLYRGIWRFASIPDLVRIIKAVAAGLVVAATVSFILTRLQNVPRSVFILDGILLVLLLGGPRFVYRWFKDRHLHGAAHASSIYADSEIKNALIVGAGKAGEMLVRDLLREQSGPYYPIAFVDDNTGKIGKEIHGIPVMGSCDKIPGIITRLGIDLIIIALPSASSRQIRRIVEICETTNLPFRILPQMQDLVSGRASLKDLRDVKIEDLLGREPVSLDWRAITDATHGKTILVTGGGGSIGAELCRQIARLKPSNSSFWNAVNSTCTTLILSCGAKCRTSARQPAGDQRCRADGKYPASTFSSSYISCRRLQACSNARGSDARCRNQ